MYNIVLIWLKYYSKGKCPECSESVDGPVELPCHHVLCLKCVVQLKELQFFYCPRCVKPFKPDFKVEVVADKR